MYIFFKKNYFKINLLLDLHVEHLYSTKYDSYGKN